MSSGTDIRDRSNKCISLFRDCVSNPTLGRLGWVENSQANFNLWVYGLSATSAGKASLDHRVRQRPDVSNTICNLLDGLEESLQDCLGQALVSTAQSTASDSALTDADNAAGSEALEDQSFNVRTVLKQLSRIHIAIRRAGNKLRYQMADAALNDTLKTDEFKDWKADMENLILMGLETQSPYSRNLSTEGRVLTSVQERLIHANLLRRHRIQYATITLREAQQREAKQKEEEAKKQTQVAEEQAPEPTPSRVEDSVDGMTLDGKEPSPKKKSSPAADVEALSKRGSQAQRTVTDLASDFKVNLADSRKSTTIITKATHTGRNQDYPRWPKAAMTGVDIPCPYCAEPLATEYVKNEIRWRGHLARDMAPYVCIFESCETPDAMFVTTDELNKHIRKEHSVQRWACNYCAPNLQEDQTMIFDTAEDWIDHVTESHFSTMPASRFDVLSETSMRTMVGPISCPLCDFCTTAVQPEIVEHVTEHMHSFALRALPWGICNDQKDSEAPDISVKSESSSSSQNSDTQYLGMSPYDDIPIDTELQIRHLQSGITDHMKIGRSPWDNLPSTTQKDLNKVMISLRPQYYGETEEPYILALMRLYCTLFQLKEAEHPSDTPLFLDPHSTYIVPTDMITELHDCLKRELEQILELLHDPVLGSNDDNSDSGKSDHIAEVGTWAIDESDAISIEAQPSEDSQYRLLDSLNHPLRKAIYSVKRHVCTFCAIISAFFNHILDLDVTGDIVFDHHETISRLRESARIGCELCELFLRQLVLPKKEKPENYLTIELDEALEEEEHMIERTPIVQIYQQGILTELRNSREYQNEEERMQNYAVTLKNPSKNPMNRKLILESSSINAITLELYCNRGDPLETTKWTYSRNIHESPLSPQSIALVKGWLKSCDWTHEGCRNLSEEPPLPTRVLDLGTLEASEDLRLLNSNGLRGRYAVASYCWGNIGPLMTTTATLESRLLHIGLETLPSTFRDCVLITRQLGIRYLWIDALCILQDDHGDWTRQVASLSKVFENSFVNIVAASATNALQGFLGSRSPSRLFTFPVEVPNNSKEGSLHLREPLDYDEPISGEPVASRAWILQEQLLCPRNIYYTSKQIVWECQETSHQESFVHSLQLNSPRLPIKKFIGQINSGAKVIFTSSHKSETYDLWYNLLEQYSSKHITAFSDRLPAISSLARVFNRVLKDEYIAGIWKDDFPHSLMWRTGVGTIPQNPEWIGPSWSWATFPGPIHYFPRLEDEPKALSQVTPSRQLEPSKLLNSTCIMSAEDKFGQVSSASISIDAEFFIVSKDDEWIFKVSFDYGHDADSWDFGSTFPCISLCATWKDNRVTYVGLILRDHGSDPPSFSRVGILEFRQPLTQWERKVAIIM